MPIGGSRTSTNDDAESAVSGSQTTIPAHARRELDINDGDRLRWQLEDDGTVSARVVRRQAGTFSEFDGYDGAETTDVTNEHDAWGVGTE
ncbi:MAG: hypothetical protein J07HB67_01837 [halophilic archaeon J07HB67]|nr:MAG: hypothetical protein J07HB67_01837 [halophilic archaeon J07HB67]